MSKFIVVILGTFNAVIVIVSFNFGSKFEIIKSILGQINYNIIQINKN